MNVTNFNYNITKLDCNDEHIPLKKRYNICKNFILHDYLLNRPVIELIEEKNYEFLKEVPPSLMDNRPNPEVKPINCIEKLINTDILACGKDNGTICFYEPFIYSLCLKIKAHDGEVLYLKQFIWNKIDYENILIISKAFSDVLRIILADINKYTIYLAVIFALLGFGLIFINSWKNKRNRKLN